MLVTRLVNVRYLTGFTGSNAAVLVSSSDANLDRIVSDGRYTTQISEQCPDITALPPSRTCPEAAASFALDGRMRRIGFESRDVTVALFGTLRGLAGEDGLVALEEPVETLRTTKDPAEIELVRRACEVTDLAFARVCKQVHAGQTERDIAFSLEIAMHDAGAEGLAFDSIVAGGPNSAIPHHEPTERIIEPGDLLKMDFGARVDGYHADMTRTCVIGSPADWQRELHALVAHAQAEGRAALGAGVATRELDEMVRSIIEVAGYGDHYTHGLGHGVGLEIHEAPFVGPTSAGRIQANSPVTVEPGVYLPGRGGVRIEDTVLVGDSLVESLTSSPRDLLELG
jgi:Xaa-Pro aminopeptidase